MTGLDLSSSSSVLAATESLVETVFTDVRSTFSEKINHGASSSGSGGLFGKLVSVVDVFGELESLPSEVMSSNPVVCSRRRPPTSWPLADNWPTHNDKKSPSWRNAVTDGSSNCAQHWPGGGEICL